MKSIMIAMPCYSAKVHFPTMRAILLDAINIIGRGDKFSIAEDIGNSDIAGSRSALFAAFVRSTADTLVFIDDDVFWQPGDLIKLIDYPVDVVGGIYPKKQEPFEWPFKIGIREEYRNDPETGLMEVLGLPGGFMKISRNCAEKMIKAYPRQTLRSTSENSQCHCPCFKTIAPVLKYQVHKYRQKISIPPYAGTPHEQSRVECQQQEYD